MSERVFVGQAGVAIQARFVDDLGAVVAIDSADLKQLRFLKPDGTEVIKSGTFVTDGTDGWLKYITDNLFLDVSGVWEYWGYAEIGSTEIETEAASFEVEESSSSLVSSDVALLNAAWGGGLANSYVSLATANSMVGRTVLRNSAWLAATPQDKIVALIEATTAIDALPFVGSRYYPNVQRLEWPRSFQYSWPYSLTIGTNLNTIEQDRMLEAIQKATVYQAIWILQTNSDTFQEHAMNQAMGIKTIREITGPLEDYYQYGQTGGGNRGSSNYHPQVFKLLNKWLTGPRVMRK